MAARSSLLEVPEDPPRFASAHERRLSVLLAPTRVCVTDPRGYEIDNAAQAELDQLVERGFVRILDRSEVVSAASVAASFKAEPAPGVREKFRQLFKDEGRTQISDLPAEGGDPSGFKIFLPRHEHVSDSAWFPASEFEFSVSPPTHAALASATRTGPDAVLGVLADAAYERTAAQLATLEVIASRIDADIVSSHLVAPMFRAVESSNLLDQAVPLYVSDASRRLADIVLRHVGAVEHLDSLAIGQVMDLAESCAAARDSFMVRLDQFVDQVLESGSAEVTARRVFAKELKPELDAFEAEFGSRLRTIKTYTKAAVANRGALVSFPLVAVGALAGLNTLWSLTLAGAGTLADGIAGLATTRAKHRSWPTLFFALKKRGQVEE